MRKIKIYLLTTAIVLGGLGLHFATPKVTLVNITGAETKRMDTAATAGVSTRDVYFIHSRDIDGGAVRVWANEDNWLYAKWNSADVQAWANTFSKENRVVALTHYGWRIQLISWFPNVTNMKVMEDGDSAPTPYLWFYSALGLLAGAFWLSFRSLKRRTKALLTPRAANTLAAQASSQGVGADKDWASFIGDDSEGGK